MEKNTITEKVHCNKCLRKTNHLVIANRRKSGRAKAWPNDPHDEYYIAWITIYTMLECCGCETVTMRRQFDFSEWDGLEEEFYPPRVSRQLPQWYEKLPKEI